MEYELMRSDYFNIAFRKNDYIGNILYTGIRYQVPNNDFMPRYAQNLKKALHTPKISSAHNFRPNIYSYDLRGHNKIHANLRDNVATIFMKFREKLK